MSVGRIGPHAVIEWHLANILVNDIPSLAHLCAILTCCRFNYEKAQSAAGWQQELIAGKQHTSETEEYGIKSFIYRATRPVHAGRLWAFMTRSKSLLVSGSGRLLCNCNAAVFPLIILVAVLSRSLVQTSPRWQVAGAFLLCISPYALQDSRRLI